MAEFDTIAKHLIHTYPRDFARFALQQDDVEVLGVVDTEQPTVEAHRTDSLIRVQVGGEEALVHHEFQTTDSSPPMPQRMASYIGHGIGQYGLPIYSNVIYLRPDAGRTDPGHYLQERHGYRVLVQGIEQGIERGGRERAIEDLLDVLAIRFALAASDPLADRIGAIDDVQRLKQLFRAAVQVPSLEAFRHLLDAAEPVACPLKPGQVWM